MPIHINANDFKNDVRFKNSFAEYSRRKVLQLSSPKKTFDVNTIYNECGLYPFLIALQHVKGLDRDVITKYVADVMRSTLLECPLLDLDQKKRLRAHGLSEDDRNYYTEKLSKSSPLDQTDISVHDYYIAKYIFSSVPMHGSVSIERTRLHVLLGYYSDVLLSPLILYRVCYNNFEHIGKSTIALLERKMVLLMSAFQLHAYDSELYNPTHVILPEIPTANALDVLKQAIDAKRSVGDVYSLLVAHRDNACPDCRGSGICDMGGTYPWGEPAVVECDCVSPLPYL